MEDLIRPKAKQVFPQPTFFSARSIIPISPSNPTSHADSIEGEACAHESELNPSNPFPLSSNTKEGHLP